MKIELYKLQTPRGFDFEARLNLIHQDELERRNRTRVNGLIRLENMYKRANLVLCDFVKIRMDHGPARAGENSPATGFELQQNEGFGEETAFLWDKSNDWCVLQYNHYGVRAAAISEYLALYVHTAPVDILLQPKIDDQLQAKIRAKRVVKKLSFSIAAKRVSDTDFDNGVALGAAAKMLKTTDADQIEITLIARRKNSLDVNLPSFMSWLRHMGGAAADSPISSAHATAKDADGSNLEILDLLNQRIVIEEILRPGVDKRYSMQDRFNALRRAHSGWRHLMT